MGFGGSASPIATSGDEAKYPAYLQNYQQSLMNGLLIDNTTGMTYDTSLNMQKAMKEIADDSPYFALDPYDPTDDLADLTSKVEEYLTLANAADVDTDMAADIAAAITYYDTSINPTSNINDTVDAAEARANPTLQRSISSLATGLRDIRAVMTTGFGMAIALLESDKTLGLQEEDAKLRAFDARQRVDAIVRLAVQHHQNRPLKLEYKRTGAQLYFDAIRLKMLTSQDNVEWDTEMKVKDRFWKIDIIQHGLNSIGAITGGMMPRSQTKRERMAAAFTTSLSTGLQVGTSMGSPQAGLAAAAGTFGIQAYGLGL